MKTESYFSNSWPSLISKSVSTDTSCRVDLPDLLTAPYFHFDWLTTIHLREVFPKNKRLGRSMQRIGCPNIRSSNDCSTLYNDWLIYDLEIVVSTLCLRELPKIHRIIKGISGLWSSVEALHIQKSQKPPCLIEDPRGRRFYFRIESFAVIL